jgi:hypothetical protein
VTALRRIVGLALAGLLLSAPVRAQEADTSGSDLRCAIWAAYVAGSAEDEDTQEAFALAMVWFLGRYEAATGKRFEESVTPQHFASLETELDVLDAECQPRMLEMGNRLETWGVELEKSGL